MRIIETLGDVNPIEYGGGLVADVGDGRHKLYYFHGLDSVNEAPFKVYRIDVDADTLDWTDADELSQYADYANCGTPSIAQQIIDAASYYGINNFDAYPLTFQSKKKLRKYWNSLSTGNEND